jgi:hypothetical protein
MSDGRSDEGGGGHSVSGRGKEERTSASRQREASSSGNLGQVRARDEAQISYTEGSNISQLVKAISPDARNVYIVWIDGNTSEFTETRAFAGQHHLLCSDVKNGNVGLITGKSDESA